MCLWCRGRCAYAIGVYGSGTGPHCGIDSIGNNFSDEFCNLVILDGGGDGESSCLAQILYMGGFHT